MTLGVSRLLPSKKNRPAAVTLGVGLLGGVGLVLLYALWLWSSPPAYWVHQQRRMAQLTEPQRRALADRFYNRKLSELSSIRKTAQSQLPRTRDLTLGIDEVNAWLREKLPDILANQENELPPGIADPLVAIDGPSIVLALRIGEGEGDDSGQVLSLHLQPTMTPDGRLGLSLQSVHSGRLPLPRGLVLDRLSRAEVPPEKEDDLRELIAVLRGDAFVPVFPIDRSRQVRILRVELEPRAIHATIRTEPRPDYH